jgi:DNA-binding response OmpR family regulator
VNSEDSIYFDFRRLEFHFREKAYRMSRTELLALEALFLAEDPKRVKPEEIAQYIWGVRSPSETRKRTASVLVCHVRDRIMGSDIAIIASNSTGFKLVLPK